MAEAAACDAVVRVDAVVAQEFNAHHNVWVEKGAGRLQISKLPTETPVDPYALLEWVNPGTQHAIREAIREDTQFMFDRGAVLLLLREGDELDVAFTFPGPQFLNTVLDALTKCQDQSTAGEAQKAFPLTITRDSLAGLLGLVCTISGRTVPHLSSWLLEQDALQRLFTLFCKAASQGDHEAARHIEGIVNASVLLCDRQLLDAITAEEKLWSGMTMISDYCAAFLSRNPRNGISDLVTHSDEEPEDSGAWQPQSGMHFQFLRRVTFRHLTDFRDTSLLRYIHQNYRLAYWVEQVIIPQCVMKTPATSLHHARAGEWDHVVATLKDMQAQNNILIVYALCSDHLLWRRLFSNPKQMDAERLDGVLRFVEELVQMAGDAFQTARVDPFRVLGSFGLFEALAANLDRVADGRELDTVAMRSLQLLERSLGGESMLVCDGLAARQFLVAEEQRTQRYPVFRAVMQGALQHPSGACRTICVAIMRKLVCKGCNFDEPTDEAQLDYSNPQCPPLIFQTAALSLVEQDIHAVFRTVLLPGWITALRGMIAAITAAGTPGVSVRDSSAPAFSVPDMMDITYQMCQILALCLEGELTRALKAKAQEAAEEEARAEPPAGPARTLSGRKSFAQLLKPLAPPEAASTKPQFDSGAKLLSHLMGTGLFVVLAKFLLDILHVPFIAAGLVRMFSTVLRLGSVGYDVSECFHNGVVTRCLVTAYRNVATRKRDNLLRSSLIHFFDLVVESNCRPLVIQLYEQHKGVLADFVAASSELEWRWQTLYCEAKKIQKSVSGADYISAPFSPSMLSQRRNSVETILSTAYSSSPASEQRFRISDPGVDSFPHSPLSPNKPTTRKPPAWPDSLIKYLSGFGYNVSAEDGVTLVCRTPSLASPTRADRRKGRPLPGEPALLREASMVVQVESPGDLGQGLLRDASTAPDDSRKDSPPPRLPSGVPDDAFLGEMSMVAHPPSFSGDMTEDVGTDLEVLDEPPAPQASGPDALSSTSSSLEWTGVVVQVASFRKPASSPLEGNSPAAALAPGPLSPSPVPGTLRSNSPASDCSTDDPAAEGRPRHQRSPRPEPPMVRTSSIRLAGGVMGPMSPPVAQSAKGRKINQIRMQGLERTKSETEAGANEMGSPMERRAATEFPTSPEGSESSPHSAGFVPSKERAAAGLDTPIQGAWSMNRLVCRLMRDGDSAASPDRSRPPTADAAPSPTDTGTEGSTEDTLTPKASGGLSLFLVPDHSSGVSDPAGDDEEDELDRSRSLPHVLNRSASPTLKMCRSSGCLVFSAARQGDMMELVIPHLNPPRKEPTEPAPASSSTSSSSAVHPKGGATLRFKQQHSGRVPSPLAEGAKPGQGEKRLACLVEQPTGAQRAQHVLPDINHRWRSPTDVPIDPAKPPDETDPEKRRPSRKPRTTSVHTDQSSLILKSTYQGHVESPKAGTLSLRRGNQSNLLDLASQELVDDFESLSAGWSKLQGAAAGAPAKAAPPAPGVPRCMSWGSAPRRTMVDA
eukprot:EG_transcript_401